MARMSYKEMAHVLNAPGHLLPTLALGSLFLVALQPSLRRDTEQQLLLLSTILGAASFFLQHKGFFYHRRPFELFFFLWVGWVLTATLKEAQAPKGWAALCLMVLSAIYYPHLMVSQHYDVTELNQMQQDLTDLHANDRRGDVQCLDVIGGCLTNVLRMHIIMATGYVNDFVFFMNSQDPRVNELRNDFLTKLKHANPRLLVLTNEQWPITDDHGYDKLKNWPEFNEFLMQRYNLSIERGGETKYDRGYRIYTLKANP
jgi:hypothetical protein